METTVLHVPIVYGMEVQNRRGTGSKAHVVKEVVPVEVRSLPACDPVVEASWAVNGHAAQWRLVDDKPYRTFMYQGANPDAAAFDAIVKKHVGEGYSQWTDLRIKRDFYIRNRYENYGGLRWRHEIMSAPHGTVLGDGRDAEMERVRRWSGSVAVIGGVPHRRGEFPVWSVGPFHSQDVSRYGEVNLVLPEDVAGSHGLFPYDARDEAVVYSRRLCEGRGAGDAASFDHGGKGKVAFHRPAPPVCQGTFARIAFGSVKLQVAGEMFDRIPPKCLIGLGQGQAAFQSLLGNRADGDLMKAMEDAMGLIAEAAKESGEERVRRMGIQAASFLEYRDFVTELSQEDRLALDLGI